jgi:hypothetical protein
LRKSGKATVGAGFEAKTLAQTVQVIFQACFAFISSNASDPGFGEDRAAGSCEHARRERQSFR